MIYTVTLNPALDYIVSVSKFQMGKTNRAEEEKLFPGGKGINVSIVLKNLGVESTALGFVSGFVGLEICRKLEEQGICEHFIRLRQGCSRINIKFKECDGTEINGRGPEIDSASSRQLMEQIAGLGDGDILSLAGSIPDSLPDTVYRDILERLEGKKIPVVVDAAGELLRQALPHRPFLVKPNHHELGELFGVEVHSREEAVPYAKKLQEQGAVNVLVSMSKEGAVLLDGEGGVHMLPAPEGKLVNAVGAGDSMVAGFLAGWLEQKSYDHAFRMGVAAGSASAFSETLASREEVERLYRRL